MTNILDLKIRPFQQPPLSLQAIRIRNFKSIADSGVIKLKPVTLFFGQNGSGKSSVFTIFDLLYIIVTSTEAERQDLSFNLNRKVNFGSFRQLIKNGDVSNKIQLELFLNVDEIKLSFEIDPEEKPRTIQHQLYELVTELRIELDFSIDPDSESKIQVSRWFINDQHSGFSFESFLDADDKCNYQIKLGSSNVKSNGKKPSHGLRDVSFLRNISNNDRERYEDFLNTVLVSYDLFRNPFMKAGLDLWRVDISEPRSITKDDKEQILEKARILFEEFIEEDQFFYQEQDPELEKYTIKYKGIDFHEALDAILYPFIELTHHLLQELSDVAHFHHIRTEFPRGLLVGDPKNNQWENEILDDLITVFNRKSDSHKDNLDYLEKILKDLELSDGLSLKETNGVLQLFFAKNDFVFNVADASSGFKQVLPIILKFAVLRQTWGEYKNMFFLIEQPELHLHPKLQAVFTQRLIDSRQENKLLLETHSENVLRKIQIAVAKGDVPLEEVVIYYFDKENSEVKVKELELDKHGFFNEPLPSGFLDETYLLTQELLNATKKN